MSRSINEQDGTPHPKVRARRYDTAVGGPLTNAKIVVYALAGHYGTDMQRRAEAVVAKRKKSTKRPGTTEVIAMQRKVQDLLDDLLS